MKRGDLIGLVILGAATVVVNGITLRPAPPRPPAPVVTVARGPDAIATVAGRPVTLADVGVEVAQLGSATPVEAHAAIRAALDAKLDGELLAAEADALGLALSDADRATLRAGEPAPAVLERQLQDAGLTVETWRAGRERALLGERVLDHEVYAMVHVTDAEIAAYVAQHRVRYRSPDRYHLAAIFVSSPASAAPAHAEAAAARVARAQAELARKRRFADVARALSDGLEGSQGGDLGALATGQPPLDDPRLAAAVTSLDAGGVTAPVRTAAGTWILRLEEHLAPVDLPLADVRAGAEAALVRERGAALVRAYLDGLRARGQVVILLPEPDDGAPAASAPVRP